MGNAAKGSMNLAYSAFLGVEYSEAMELLSGKCVSFLEL